MEVQGIVCAMKMRNLANVLPPTIMNATSIVLKMLGWFQLLEMSTFHQAWYVLIVTLVTVMITMIERLMQTAPLKTKLLVMLWRSLWLLFDKLEDKMFDGRIDFSIETLTWRSTNASVQCKHPCRCLLTIVSSNPVVEQLPPTIIKSPRSSQMWYR